MAYITDAYLNTGVNDPHRSSVSSTSISMNYSESQGKLNERPEEDQDKLKPSSAHRHRHHHLRRKSQSIYGSRRSLASISAISMNWSGSQAHLNTKKLHFLPGDDGAGLSVPPKGKITPILLLAAFTAALGNSFPHGWNTGVLNSPSVHIQEFLNASFYHRFSYYPSALSLTVIWSASVSIYLVGGTIGAYSPIFLVDRFGRRKSLMILQIFGLISALLFSTCKIANSYEMFIIARLLVGFSCGAGAGIVPIYLTEIAPVRIRGAMGVLHQLALTFGIFISMVIGLRQVLGSEERWPFLLAVTGIPCIFSLIVLPFMPESPRHLLINLEDREGATNALRKLRGDNDVLADIQEINLEAAYENGDDYDITDELEREDEWTLKRLLTTKQLRLPLALIIVLASCQQFSGINAVFYYSTSIFRKAGIRVDYVQYANLATGFINVLITIISVWLVEKAGRRVLLLGGMIAMVISAAMLIISIKMQDKVPWLSYIAIISVISFVIGFAIGLGSIPQFIGAELFQTGPKPMAMSLAGFFNWLCNFIVAISFPPLAEIVGEYSFFFFISFIVIFGVFVFKKLPETKGKTIEEIGKNFKLENINSNNKKSANNGIYMKKSVNGEK